MSKSKHTSETWIDTDARCNNWGPYSSDCCDIFASVDDDEGNQIAVVCHPDIDTLAARVSLIAAAPEMLAQLKAVAVQLNALPGLNVPPGVTDVIVKASGGK